MPNRWVQFVRDWAQKNNESYMCAATKPEVRDAYRAKYGVSKRVPQYKEEERMGAEDVNVVPPKKKGGRPPKYASREEARQANIQKKAVRRVEKKQEATERGMMGGEDFNVKSPVAELPPPPVVRTLETERIIPKRNPAQMVFDAPELRKLIKDYTEYLTENDKERLLEIYRNARVREQVLQDSFYRYDERYSGRISKKIKKDIQSYKSKAYDEVSDLYGKIEKKIANGLEKADFIKLPKGEDAPSWEVKPWEILENQEEDTVRDMREELYSESGEAVWGFHLIDDEDDGYKAGTVVLLNSDDGEYYRWKYQKLVDKTYERMKDYEDEVDDILNKK